VQRRTFQLGILLQSDSRSSGRGQLLAGTREAVVLRCSAEQGDKVEKHNLQEAEDHEALGVSRILVRSDL